MSNLVIMKDEQAVTSSLDVAETFEKQHKHVLAGIDELVGVAENSADLFWEDTYIHPQNKQPYRMIYMNRDGFALLAMGFTGKKALQFKMEYIQAFNQMEKQIQSSQLPMSQEDIMIATLETQKELKENLKLVQDDVAGLKQEINLSRSQKHRLSGLVRKNVYNALGGKRAQAYNDRNLRARLYSNHWREIKNYFDVEAYEEIPKLKFDEAIEFAELWDPSTELKMLIKERNNQIALVI